MPTGTDNASMGGVGVRVGHGYDLHRLEPRLNAATGKPLIVGGVELREPGPPGPDGRVHPLGVIAHSDGDVLFHATTDAILGALGLPDIGQLFPDNAPENAGRASDVFLRRAGELMRAQGWDLGNIDATVILERPRIGSRKDEMRANLARALNGAGSMISVGRINVKGKSHERVDAVGEGRAIECHVVALLVRSG